MDMIAKGKPVGIVITLDSLGRVTIPKKYRNHLDCEVRSKVEVFLHEDGVFIKKHMHKQERK